MDFTRQKSLCTLLNNVIQLKLPVSCCSLQTFVVSGSRESAQLPDRTTSSWRCVVVCCTSLCSIYCSFQLQVCATQHLTHSRHLFGPQLTSICLHRHKVKLTPGSQKKGKGKNSWTSVLVTVMFGVDSDIIFCSCQLHALQFSALWKPKRPQPEKKTCSGASR